MQMASVNIYEIYPKSDLTSVFLSFSKTLQKYKMKIEQYLIHIKMKN